MKNREIADIFLQIADALEFKGENTFRVNAYRKAARTLSEMPKDIEAIAREGKLEEISGIGTGLHKKIEEYLATGKIKKLEEANEGIPDGIFDLRRIPGLGPKTLSLAFRKLKVKNVDDLKKVIENGSLAKLPMMGEKKVENISRGLALVTKIQGRILLGRALPLVDGIIAELKKDLRSIKQISPAGSLRRMCETIGDIDILATGEKPGKIIRRFTELPIVREILGAGETKASVILKSGHQADLRVVPEESYGAALQYFTGSKAHNIKLRSLAKDKGLKINEYGVFKGEKLIAGKTEEEVYKAVNMLLMPPEIREDRGEIEAALEGKLPKLIGYADLKGDLHCHSLYSDGRSKIEEVVMAARAIGYEYILITDHSQAASYAHGLSPARLKEESKEIDGLQKRFKEIRILKGAEVDILSDGKLDFPDSILKEMDLVVASVYSGFKNNVTGRIIKAMENPHVDIIAHPTGRLISTREGYVNLDMDKIFEAAARTGTFLEINSFPDRLDLNDLNCKRAKEFGVKFSIGTDSHHSDMLGFARLGISVARRGWVGKEDVINTYTWEEIKKKRKSL
ncbi:MAG: DNA polymerase/3'-5' exonuclease PolX [Planctomycetes bacterium]|nr:DNA polymerase/3'-5' exonuclease PolX [Planctomycetota bacterium]